MGSNPAGAWVSIYCEFCVSGTDPREEPISHQEESYRVYVCVVCVCVFEWVEAQQQISTPKISR